MSLLGTLHGDLVFKRGTRVLSARLVDLRCYGARRRLWQRID